MTNLLPELETPYDPACVMDLYRHLYDNTPVVEAICADFDTVNSVNLAISLVDTEGNALVDTEGNAKPWLPRAIEGPGGHWAAPWAVDYRWLCAGVVYASRRFLSSWWEAEDRVGIEDAYAALADEGHKPARWERERERFTNVFGLWKAFGEMMRDGHISLGEADERYRTSAP